MKKVIRYIDNPWLLTVITIIKVIWGGGNPANNYT